MPSGNSSRRSLCDNQVCEPVIRNEAIQVSSNRLTCATDEPNRVGTIRRMVFCTSGACQPQRGQASKPIFAISGSCTNNCNTPEIRMAQASDVIGIRKCGAHHKAAA